jgi:hypothetical protein
MYANYRQINKMTIKDMFLILIIDKLLDELHREIFITKLDIHYGYHQIRVRK